MALSAERYVIAVTSSLAAAAQKSLANPAAKTLARRRLARTVAALSEPQSARAAQKHANTALTAILAARSPADAQAVMNGIADRQFGGTRTPAIHHASLRAAAALTLAARHRAQGRLIRAHAATAAAALVTSRRERLLRKHLTATLAAWNALTQDLDPQALASQIRADERASQQS
jgi:hypothetical protein